MKLLFIGPMKSGGIATINKEVQKMMSNIDGVEYDIIENTAYQKKNRASKIIGYIHLYLIAFIKMVLLKPNFVYLQTSQTGYFHQTIVLLFAKILRKKTIAHFHARHDVPNSDRYFKKKIIILSQLYIDKMIVLSQASKTSLIMNGWKKKIYIVPNFIDDKVCSKKLLKITERKYDILYIGRMVEEKGIFDILRIANILSSYNFLFIGEFSSRVLEKKFSDRLKCIKNVTWIGPLYNNKKFEYIKDSKILLLPSRTEVFPLTIIECSLYGTIPVVTSVGFVPEIVKDGYNGFIIEINSTGKNIEKLRKILDNPDGLIRVSKNCREAILARYTAKVILKNFKSMMLEWIR